MAALLTQHLMYEYSTLRYLVLYVYSLLMPQLASGLR